MQKFKIIGKPLLGEKNVEGKKKERRMQSLVATTSALARTMCVRTNVVRALAVVVDTKLGIILLVRT